MVYHKILLSVPIFFFNVPGLLSCNHLLLNACTGSTRGVNITLSSCFNIKLLSCQFSFFILKKKCSIAFYICFISSGQAPHIESCPRELTSEMIIFSLLWFV